MPDWGARYALPRSHLSGTPSEDKHMADLGDFCAIPHSHLPGTEPVD